MTYLVVYDAPGRGVRPEELMTALGRDWPGVIVTEGYGEVDGVVWTYMEDGQRLEGASHVDGTCIYLDGALALSARCALWFRGVVPQDVVLHFCDEAFTFHGVVTGEMGVEDVCALATQR